MGDVAEMMMEGILCAGCGDFIDMGHMGCPCYCKDCEGDY